MKYNKREYNERPELVKIRYNKETRQRIKTEREGKINKTGI